MTSDYTRNSEAERAIRARMITEQRESASAATENGAALRLVPNHADTRGRGNEPVRTAAVQQMQQSYGNRAVQRYLGQGRGASTPVQRSLWDDASGWVSENVGRNPIDMLGIGHGLNQVFGEQHTTGADGRQQSSPSRFYGALRSAESTLMGGVNSLAGAVSDVPVLGSAASWGADFIGNRAQQATGFLAGAGDMVGGIAGMVDNPLQTLGTFQTMAENNLMMPGFMNPFRMAHAGYDVLSGNRGLGDAAHRWLDPAESMRQSTDFLGNMASGIVRPYGQAISEGRGNEAVGRLGFDILSNMTGGGEATAANRAAGAARGAEVVGATARGAEVAGATARGAEVAGGVAHGAGSIVHPSAVPHAPVQAPSVMRPPTDVVQMPAVSPHIQPGMPQPPHWQAGPVGTPPVSNPVREMPAITPGQASSGQMPRDWGTYAPGRGRLPGQVGEMPVVGANPGLREPTGFGNNAGAIRPGGGGPLPTEPVIGSGVTPSASPSVPRSSHEPVAYFPTEPGSIGAYPTMPATPSAPAVPRSSHEPVAYFPTMPASPAAYPTMPAMPHTPAVPRSSHEPRAYFPTEPGSIAAYPTIPAPAVPAGPVAIPYPNIGGPIHNAPTPLRGGGGHIPVSAGDEAGAMSGVANNPRMGPYGAHTPMPSQPPTRPSPPHSDIPADPGLVNPEVPRPPRLPDDIMGEYLREGELVSGLDEIRERTRRAREGAQQPVPNPGDHPLRNQHGGAYGFNRLPDFVRGLDKLGDYETMMQVIRGHGLDPAEYLNNIHRRVGE